MKKDYILVLDFGSQYTQLIARRLREFGIYAEIVPYFESLESIKEKSPKGIILSGGPASVYEEDAYKPDSGVFSLGIPVLGICYGMQYIAHFFGGKVVRAQAQEFGKAVLELLGREQSLAYEFDKNALKFISFSENELKNTHSALVDLWEDSVRASHHFLQESDIVEIRAEVEQAFYQVENLLVATYENDFIGFIGVQDNEIPMLFVSPKYFNFGIGKALMFEAFNRYLKGFDIIKLDCNEQNTRALKFYQKLGFTQVSRSEKDSAGRNFPILHLNVKREELLAKLENAADSKSLESAVVLETNRTYLREYRMSDLAALQAILDEKTMYAWGHGFSEAECREWIEKQLTHYEKHGFGFWAVVDKASGQIIGNAGLNYANIELCSDGLQDTKSLDTTANSKTREILELGYIINHRFWRQGLGFEVASACAEYAFKKLGVKELCVLVKDDNTRSLCLARKLGMRVVGENIKHYRGQDMTHLVLKVSELVTCVNAEGFSQKCEAQEIAKAKSSSTESNTCNSLFLNVKQDSIVWMSHADKVETLPNGFVELAKSGNTHYCAIADLTRQIYALQFHPEVVHSECGGEILKNFALEICGVDNSWNMKNFAQSEIEKLRQKVFETDKEAKVLCAVSGGVDSSVVATLLYRAIGENLIPVFVDTGLLRKGEKEAVEKMFKENLKVPLIVADAKELFLGRLKGVIDPEKKRKIIGETFIEVFEAEAKKHNVKGEIKFLAQGTLYPDVIESVSVKGPSKTIKSHHNVGGLPEWMKFELIEPLRELFKDEVRALGRELGMPESMLMRHPFPGPGLAIRIMGEVNDADLMLLKEADAIFIEELHKWKLYDSVWQAFCVLLNVRSVGVMGDNRTYDNTICVRAVEAMDGMTASFSHLPHEFLESVSNRIINEVEGINRVVYDITSKPPGTIEWE